MTMMDLRKRIYRFGFKVTTFSGETCHDLWGKGKIFFDIANRFAVEEAQGIPMTATQVQAQYNFLVKPGLSALFHQHYTACPKKYSTSMFPGKIFQVQGTHFHTLIVDDLKKETKVLLASPSVAAAPTHLSEISKQLKYQAQMQAYQIAADYMDALIENALYNSKEKC